MTIKGDGALIAYGGEGAAGIGCGYATECGDIIIEGGTIEAYAGYQHETSWRAGSAGIGGAGQYAGRKSKCGNITITGGKVTAKHDKGIWDIGPGDAGTCGTVQVNEGTIAPGVRVYDSASASEPVPAPEVTPSSNIRKIVQIIGIIYETNDLPVFTSIPFSLTPSPSQRSSMPTSLKAKVANSRTVCISPVAITKSSGMSCCRINHIHST